MDEDSKFAAQLQAQEIHDARQEAQRVRASLGGAGQNSQGQQQVARGIPVEENEYYDSELSGEEVEGENGGITQEERDRQIAEQIMMMQMQEMDQDQGEVRRQHREQRQKQGPASLNQGGVAKEETLADKFFSVFGCGPKSKPDPKKNVNQRRR